MGSNVIQIINVIELKAIDKILLVDANLYVLPHIDRNLKGKGKSKKYIDSLSETLKQAGDSFVVFFVQGNSKNTGKYLMDELDIPVITEEAILPVPINPSFINKIYHYCVYTVQKKSPLKGGFF